MRERMTDSRLWGGRKTETKRPREKRDKRKSKDTEEEPRSTGRGRAETWEVTFPMLRGQQGQQALVSPRLWPP